MVLSKKLENILYNASLAFLILLLICFALVLPIDNGIGAASSENDTLNIFIVIGAMVLFIIFYVPIFIGRILYYRSCLVDIPRRYLPITAADLPHEPSRTLVLKNMDRSKELGVLFKEPKGPVIHPGVEPPSSCDDPHIEKLFPEYLNYRSCLKVITNRLKYQGIFIDMLTKDMRPSDTFSDVIHELYIKGNSNINEVNQAKRLIHIHDLTCFSGKDITRDQLREFVELCIYFSDLNITSKEPRYLRPTSTRQTSYSGVMTLSRYDTGESYYPFYPSSRPSSRRQSFVPKAMYQTRPQNLPDLTTYLPPTVVYNQAEVGESDSSARTSSFSLPLSDGTEIPANRFNHADDYNNQSGNNNPGTVVNTPIKNKPLRTPVHIGRRNLFSALRRPPPVSRIESYESVIH